MTAHDLATGTSWAVIDRPYNSDASRLFLSMSAHSKFLELRRSLFGLAQDRRLDDCHSCPRAGNWRAWQSTVEVARPVSSDLVGLCGAVDDDAEPRKHHLL